MCPRRLPSGVSLSKHLDTGVVGLREVGAEDHGPDGVGERAELVADLILCPSRPRRSNDMPHHARQRAHAWRMSTGSTERNTFTDGGRLSMTTPTARGRDRRAARRGRATASRWAS